MAKSRSRYLANREEPPWWVRDVLVAFLVGVTITGGSVAWQSRLDDNRAARDRAIAAQQARHAEQIENLRYVRDHSSDDPLQARLFAGFDLAGQNLSGLQLRGANFRGANLEGASLILINLNRGEWRPATGEVYPVNSDLRGANLCHANLTEAALEHAELSWANFTDVDLTFTHLDGANLAGADLTAARLNVGQLKDITTILQPFGLKAFCHHLVSRLNTSCQSHLYNVT